MCNKPVTLVFNTHPLTRITNRARRSRRSRGAGRTLKEVKQRVDV